MDFRETGLPVDPLVYKAFEVYRKSLKALPEEEQEEMRQLRVAQLLVQTGCKDKELIALALLLGQPGPVWDVISGLFGKRIIELKDELTEHFAESFRRIHEASDPVRLLYMAEQTVNLLLLDDNNINTDFQEEVFALLRGTTSSPDLEARYDSALGGHYASMNPAITVNGLYPEFESTKLADSEQVRAAFRIVTSDPRTSPEKFAYALHIAETLSTVPSAVNPVAIAAALIDISISETDDGDAETWAPEIGEDVANLLYEGSIYSKRYNDEITNGSASFKQIALVVVACKIKELHGVLEQRLPSIKDNPHVLKETLSRNYALGLELDLQMQPALKGNSGAPELEAYFNTAVEDFLTYIASNTTPGMSLRKPPPPSPE